MIELDTFKAGATKFRKNAKEMGFQRRLTTLLDIYAYALFGRTYSLMHNLLRTRHVATPTYPPPYLQEAGERWGLDPVRILEAMEMQQPRGMHSEPPRELTIEQLTELLSQFQEAARACQINLSDDGIEDLLCLAYFDCPLDDVLAALESGERFQIRQAPEYLGAACVFLDVNVRQAVTAFERIRS